MSPQAQPPPRGPALQGLLSALRSSATALAVISMILWVALVIVLFVNGSLGGTPALLRPASSSSPGAQPTSTADLQAQNQKLQEQLRAYESLQQDLMAEQVYEKTWGKLVSLFTIGGAITALLGLVGYRELLRFIKQKSDQKISEITQQQVTEIFSKEANHRMEQFFNQPEVKQALAFVLDQQADGLRQYAAQIREPLEAQMKMIAAQSIARIQVATAPVTGAPNPSAGAPTDAGTAALSLKRKLDYTDVLSPARNEGQEASLVGFAVAATLEYQIVKTSKEKVIISPRYIYNLTRKQEGTLSSDSGARLQDALKLLRTAGAVEESAWPYKVGEYAADPPEAVKGARHYKIKRSIRLKNLDEIKDALQNVGPVIIGFTVYDSFNSQETIKSGVIPMPQPSDQVIGGHAACCVGYDDDRELLKFKNSFGVAWGDQGYGYLPYAYEIEEAWAITM